MDHRDSYAQPRKLAKVERGAAACGECRRHKIKCNPHEDDPQHLLPCARCQRMDLTCEFAKHNRGRKRKRPQNLLMGGMMPPPARAGLSSSSHRTLPQIQGGQSSEGPPLRSFGDPRFPFISTEQGGPSSPSSNLQSRSYDNDYNCHGHVQSLRRMVGNESDQDDSSDGDGDGHTNGYSDSEPNAHGHGAKKKVRMAMRRSDLVDDPVRAGHVSEEEGRALFQLFLSHFNTSLPLLDPAFHTHDYVRNSSSFLYTAILCVMSRYLSAFSSVDQNISPESAQSVHQQILVLARDHLTWSFAEAVTDINAVRAMVILSLHKEPDDDRAGYYISRAVLMGKELNLGRMPYKSETDKMSEGDLRCLRMRQRTWLCLFFVNSIFNMQFRQPMLILQDDPLVATAHHWLKRSQPETILRDTQLVCSTDLRRKFLHYRDLLIGTGVDQPPYRSALSLSLLTRSLNQDWDVTSEAWIRDLIDVGGTSSHINKPRIWTSALRLNLNLLIVNQTLRLPAEDRIDLGAPNAIPAFHHCLNAATTVLVRFEGLERQQLTFASDTFLHFALYAATLLSTLCRGQHPYRFEADEIEHCRRLISKTADVLEASSAYPHDSPALHGFYLRRLNEYLPQTTLERSHSISGSLASSTHDRHDNAHITPSGAGGGGGAIPIDPVLQGISSGTVPLNAALSNVLGNELDFLMADFPWMDGSGMNWATAAGPPMGGPPLLGEGGVGPGPLDMPYGAWDQA